MSERAPDVVIVFDRGAELIGGELTGQHGQRRRFDGWLELLAVLERQWAGLPDEAPATGSSDSFDDGRGGGT